MDEKYISDEEFEALSGDEQVQLLIDMLKEVPRDDLLPLMKLFKEISRIQRILKEK